MEKRTAITWEDYVPVEGRTRELPYGIIETIKGGEKVFCVVWVRDRDGSGHIRRWRHIPDLIHTPPYGLQEAIATLQALLKQTEGTPPVRTNQRFRFLVKAF